MKLQAAGVGLDAYFPGDKVTFDTLDVTFGDEDLEKFQRNMIMMDACLKTCYMICHLTV